MLDIQISGYGLGIKILETRASGRTPPAERPVVEDKVIEDRSVWKIDIDGLVLPSHP
jgi:hypothetical protein